MKKKFKIRLKFRNETEEGAFKVAAYSIIGALIMLLVFGINAPLVYAELFVLTVFLVYVKREDTLNYVYSGAVMAFVIYNLLGFALSTPLPIVVVVSSSMQHDDPQRTFYSWSEANLGYNRTYIDSWGFGSGFSMGDMPVVAGSNGYKVGDIIVYDANQPAPIIHRIVKVNPDGTYQTKGDNNSGQLPFETSIRLSQVKGKVVFIIPKLGYIKIILMRLFGGFG